MTSGSFTFMKHLLFLFFLLTVGLLFVNVSIDGTILVSFMASAAILFLILFYHLYLEKSYSPFLSAFLVFNFLFFIIAPVTQISYIEGSGIAEFATYFPYRKPLVLRSNQLIMLFNTVFIIGYITFKKHFLHNVVVIKNHSVTRLLPITIITILAISLLVFVGSIGFVQYEFSRPSWQSSRYSVATILMFKKVLFILPFAGIVLCFKYIRNKITKPINLITVVGVLICFVVLLFWFKNPLTEKRNALGPIYICLLILCFPKLLKSNLRMLGFLFMVMIIAFPLIAAITHTDATFLELLKKPSLLTAETNKGGGIISAFNTLNYDAFANIMATLEYVQSSGFSMGYQALSAFLFFVPRGLWESKPISTGELVGDYLIEQYDFTYSNLSNPLVSEGYINFGIMGVIIGALSLAFITVYFMKWLKSPNPLKQISAYYLAIHFIFLLRGDFTNGFSYFIGTLVGVLLIPSLVEQLFKHLYKTQRKWKQQQA